MLLTSYLNNYKKNKKNQNKQTLKSMSTDDNIILIKWVSNILIGIFNIAFICDFFFFKVLGRKVQYH